MGRKRKEINPECGKRLKVILREQNVTQEQLSESIHLSQQVISAIVNGKARLTEPTAAAVINEFPIYNYEWLMGCADDKLVGEKELKRTKSRDAALYYLLYACGYEARKDVVRDSQGKVVRIEGFRLTRKSDGKQVSLNFSEFRSMKNEIMDVAEFILDKQFKGQ